MVFFTCNACGASIKKNQVEKHYQNECRNCEVLSCMDCGKDFYGDEYASHTSCISEAEKYQGSLFKDTGGSSKGERKQQEWLEKVKQSTASAKVSGRIASLLERISEYPNIPRKQKKFENFVKNSINVRDSNTLSQLWEAFSTASKPAASVDPQPTATVKSTIEEDSAIKITSTTSEESSKKKKMKHSKHVEEAQHNGTAEAVASNGELPAKKKKNKRSKVTEIEGADEIVVNGDKKIKGTIIDHVDISKGKKKKRKHSELEENVVSKKTKLSV